MEFAGFRLRGDAHKASEPNERGWRWIEVLGLYLGVSEERLRYFTAEGERGPTPPEAGAQAQQPAERQRAEALAARLRALGYEA